MTSTPHPPDQSASYEMALSALSHDHRRAVLRALDQAQGGEVVFGRLLDNIVDRVQTDGPRDLTHRDRVRIALYHVHLPKLEACGVVEFDDETERVEIVSQELVETLLTLSECLDGQPV